MAASDAEAAFLQAMQVVGDEDSLAGARDDPALEDDGEEEEEDYDPSNLNYEPSVTLMPTATDRLASPSGLSAQDSLIITTIPGPTETPLPSLTSPSARQQPRKLAGFILDDADEDGDEASLQPPSRSGSVGSLSRAGGSLSSPGRSLPPTVFSPRPDISLHSSVQDRAGSADASNSVNDPTVSLAAVTATTATTIPSTSAAIIPVSHRPSAPTNGFGSRSSVQALSPSQASPTTALPTPLTTGQSRARLPHDKVGILEDRIADDPKGDWDAWLTLISEHRKRNKIEDARSVYERFFKVFPSAVRCRLLQWQTNKC